MCKILFFSAYSVLILFDLSGICNCASFSILPLLLPGGSNQPLPPDASPIATPSFDVHRGKCPDIKFNCDNVPIRYYCSSDLACFSWQKCCLTSCSYYCTVSVGGWRNGTDQGDLKGKDDISTEIVAEKTL